MNTIRAIIFDLDGVICFTDQYHYQAWKEMADAELGEPLTIRGEALTLEQFAALSNIIGNRQKK